MLRGWEGSGHPLHCPFTLTGETLVSGDGSRQLLPLEAVVQPLGQEWVRIISGLLNPSDFCSPVPVLLHSECPTSLPQHQSHSPTLHLQAGTADTLWGALCQHWRGGGRLIVLSDKNSCQMQVSPWTERLQDGWGLADVVHAPRPNAAGGCQLPVTAFRCARPEWEGGVMLLPSTGPLRAGHGEKAKGRRGRLFWGAPTHLSCWGWWVTSCSGGWGVCFLALPQHWLSQQLTGGRG